jgi:hypothetical protein
LAYEFEKAGIRFEKEKALPVQENGQQLQRMTPPRSLRAPRFEQNLDFRD